jgi:ParB family chromosome partitioning protein
LGRGLSDLLAGSGAPQTRGVIEVDIDRLRPNPFQPRRCFDEDEVASLADSIREQGLLQPLLVRETDSGYEIVAGERRWRAARLLSLATVACLVHQMDDRQSMQVALVENLQREDLNAMEEAHAYRRLLDEFNMTQEELADQIGKSRPAVANRLRLLALPIEVQEAVEEGTLTEGHARALLALKDEPARLYQVCERAIRECLSVRQTEELARKPSVPAPEPPAEEEVTEEKEVFRKAVTERLQQALATRVSIEGRRNGAGMIKIVFHDSEELSRLVDEIAPQEDVFF